MPNRWPISSGNWSNSAIWSGSLIPTASDDVFANGQTVNIDTNITVTSLRNIATGSAIAGGRFEINSNITASAGTIQGNAIEVIRYIGSTGCSINGNIIRSLLTNFTSSVLLSGSGVVNISGSLNGQSSVNFYCINAVSNQTINFTGSITTTTTDDRNRIFNITSPCILNITGNMNTTGANQIVCNGNTVTINIDGTLTNTGATSIIATPGSSSIITITGSITGPAVSSTTAHTTLISGSVKSSASPAISLTGNSILQVIGPISSSTTAVGVSSTSTTATNIFSGPFYNTGSFNAVYAYRMQMIEPTSTTWRFDTETGGSKILYTANQLPGVPQQTDVRHGTQYNFGLTGSLKMPDPTVVKAGVAVGTTTGSAIFTPQDMFNVLTQDITQTGSIGSTLKNATTVQTTAATISAFKV